MENVYYAIGGAVFGFLVGAVWAYHRELRGYKAGLKDAGNGNCWVKSQLPPGSQN